MNHARRVIALVIFIAIAAVVYIFNSRGETAQQDAVTFVNKTHDHHYDRPLRASIRLFQDRTGIQLGIILKDKLPLLTSIEDFAEKSFKAVKLGEKFSGNALLFVWAEKEHLFKIEVSYNLEPVFPDALCHRLEDGARTFMLSTSPYARRDFLTELTVTMGLHYLDYKQTGRLSELTLPALSPGLLSNYLSGGAGIVGRGYAATLERVKAELKPLPPALVSEMQPDASIEKIVSRYMQSLEMGIGDPQLPLLTEGSSYFRMEKPHAPGYLQRINRYLKDAMPYRIVESGDLAAVLFMPNHPVLPILLRRNEKGLWLVDEPKAWATFHLSEDGSSRLKYNSSPFAFAAVDGTGADRSGSLYAGRAYAPELITYPFDLRERLRHAEREISNHPSLATSYLNLAELLHFEMYWIQGAAPLYEKALALAPDRIDLRWRLIDIYRNMAEIDGEEQQYIAILRQNPNDRYARFYYDWLLKTYN